MKFFLMILILLIACEKDADPILDEVPDCIYEKISAFKSSTDPCDLIGASVTMYSFQDEVVYAFDMGQCISDGSTTIYNEACEEICILGTILGITNCMNEAFENAEKLTILWQQ